MSNQQIAKTILSQLGGNKFIAMTGAYNLTSDTNCLIFKLKAKTLRNIKAVKITLASDDTYTVTFYSIRKFEVKTVSEHTGVYCDMLTDLFTQETGLYTSLVSFG